MKNQEQRQKFAERLRKLSKSVRYFEGFDDAMIYSIINRIEKHVENFDDINLLTCENQKTKIKKLTNRKLVSHYNTVDIKGIKMNTQEIIPIWGFPSLGNITSVLQIDENGRELLFKNKISPEFDSEKIYIMLIKNILNNNKVVKNGEEYNIINDSVKKYELVLIKSDTNSNSKL